jgi:hypothetical protein
MICKPLYDANGYNIDHARKLFENNEEKQLSIEEQIYEDANSVLKFDLKKLNSYMVHPEVVDMIKYYPHQLLCNKNNYYPSNTDYKCIEIDLARLITLLNPNTELYWVINSNATIAHHGYVSSKLVNIFNIPVTTWFYEPKESINLYNLQEGEHIPIHAILNLDPHNNIQYSNYLAFVAPTINHTGSWSGLFSNNLLCEYERYSYVIEKLAQTKIEPGYKALCSFIAESQDDNNFVNNPILLVNDTYYRVKLREEIH